MPDWRVARSLDKLLIQLNTLAPNRSRASDGSIGDDAHRAQGSASDHNPWFVLGGQPIVTARDITHDPAGGLDCDRLAAALIASRDPRIKYLIWRGRICDSRPQFRPWTWQPSSGHFQHLHLSVMANASADDTRPWALPGLIEEDDMASWDDELTSPSGYKAKARDWVVMSNVKAEQARDIAVQARDVALRNQATLELIAGKVDQAKVAVLTELGKVQAGGSAAELAAALAPLLPSTDGVTPAQLEAELHEFFGRIYNLGGVQRSPGSEV